MCFDTEKAGGVDKLAQLSLGLDLAGYLFEDTVNPRPFHFGKRRTRFHPFLTVNLRRTRESVCEPRHRSMCPLRDFLPTSHLKVTTDDDDLLDAAVWTRCCWYFLFCYHSSRLLSTPTAMNTRPPTRHTTSVTTFCVHRFVPVGIQHAIAMEPRIMSPPATNPPICFTSFLFCFPFLRIHFLVAVYHVTR